MNTPNVTALSQLKVGDIFELAELVTPPSASGVHPLRWQVDSIGEIVCGVVMESMASVSERLRFATPPLMIASRTSVLHLPAWNGEKR